MPYKDKEKERVNAKQRKARYLKRKHDEKYGVGVGDMRGRHENSVFGLKGNRSYRWNKLGIGISSRGYIKVRVGKEHPLADPSGFAYLHKLIWLTAGNPKPDYMVTDIHHKNGNRLDNQLDNLELLSKSEHQKRHWEMGSHDVCYTKNFPPDRSQVDGKITHDLNKFPPDLRLRQFPEVK